MTRYWLRLAMWLWLNLKEQSVNIRTPHPFSSNFLGYCVQHSPSIHSFVFLYSFIIFFTTATLLNKELPVRDFSTLNFAFSAPIPANLPHTNSPCFSR